MAFTNDNIIRKEIRSENSGPAGIICPYCDLNEYSRVAVINKHLTWLCEDCFKDIVDHEYKAALQRHQNRNAAAEI